MVLRGLEEFRIHLGGELTVTLLRAIGQGFEAHEIDDGFVSAAIRQLECRRYARDLRLAAGQ